MIDEKIKISFVIPCYGSEKTIRTVVDDIIKTVSGKNPYEVICVNDCSPDNVYDVLKDITSSNENIKVINLSKNFGQQSAVLAGFNHVTGDYIVVLDDDGQTDPKVCYELLNGLDDKVDVVFAKYPEKKHSAFRNLGSTVTKLMTRWLINWPKNIANTSYYATKRFVIDEVIRYPNAYPFMSGLILRSTKRISNVEIEHHDRLEGQSGYTLHKLLHLWLNGFTAFSVKPLRIASVFGFFTSLTGFVFAIITLIRKIINPNILIGYSSMMCVLLVVGGMIMLMLGLLGEYIGRIYISLNKAPQYVIRNTLNIRDDKE